MPENTRFGRGKNDQPYRPETSANDPREIKITPDWNVRDMSSQKTIDHIQDLKTSILARANKGLPGLIYAIKVKYDPATETKTLVDGQCRLLACRELWNEGHKIYIPEERVKGSEAELFATALAGNTGQENTQLEIGLGCLRLITGFNWSPQMVAEQIGKSKRYITEALALTDAPAEIKEMLTEGKVSAPAVRHELKKAEKEKRAPETAIAPLKEAVAESYRRAPAVPEPKQATLPGTPARKAKKQKPVTRPKKPSAKETALKSDMAATAKLGIDLARHIIADDLTFEKLEAFAKKLLAAAGLKE